MAIQRTFEANHLRDYLRSAEGIHKMFEQLGYDVYEPEPFEADQLDMAEADTSNVRAFYTVGNVATHTAHNIWLFEVEDTNALRLRGIAYELLQRGETHTIVVTKDYSEVIFVHPYSVGNLTKSNTRINKLKVDVKNPTRHDADTINDLLARGRSPDEIYKAQDEAFNVTKVTNKFYKEYREYFKQVQESVVAWNKGVVEFQNSDQRDKLHAFVQRLMGRLMFLYFLQRKGWLGGDSNFLTTQYAQMVKRHAGELTEKDTYYYREILEPLFFETLNKRRDENWTNFDAAGKKARIPYLNGGLFDRSRDPDDIILLPDSLFDPNGGGLLAFFNRYNFTIADDTPLEQDVAVDPEMLGKVFENMLEEEDRGQSGSFYTPRTIVSYMCQEALAGYLEESANIPRDDTRKHFNPDADIEFSPEQAEAVSEALDTLTVLDPAVGSGSFLIGMLNEIITLRKKAAQALSQIIDPAQIAQWKEQIIRDTLYGVDIKQGAIEIAQLRLWLAMIVTQTMEDAKPLPNLDYKLMAGNSLIETIDGEPILTENARAMLSAGVQPRQRGLFEGIEDSEVLKLAELRQEYFTASPERRKQLSEDIRFRERKVIERGLDDLLEHAQTGIKNLENKNRILEKGKWNNRDAKQYKDLLAKEAHLEQTKRDLWNDEASLPFFLYRLHFNNVFASKGGFDVVVANPPYVRQELIKEQKPEFQASYPEVYAGTADLFVYFFARAINLLREKGKLSFITPNKFMRANYGKKLRVFLSDKITLNTLIDFGDLPIFDATTYPMITIASKSNPDNNEIKVLEVQVLEETESLYTTLKSAFPLPQKILSEDGWQLNNPKTRALMDKLNEAGKPLGEYVDDKFYRGIVTGLNEAFIIDETKRAELIEQDPKSTEVIKPYLRGRDIKRWQVSWENLYIVFTRRGIDIDEYPAIKAHLMQWKTDLTPKKSSNDKRGRKPGSYKWYEIQDDIAYYQEFEKPKIIYQEIATFQSFAYTQATFFTNNKCFIIPDGDLFLLSVLNSRITWFYLGNIVSKLRGGAFAMQSVYLEQLPIPNAPETLCQRIASLAQECLDAAKDEPDKLPELEERLNELVYQAYGLDEDDIQVIEGYLLNS